MNTNNKRFSFHAWTVCTRSGKSLWCSMLGFLLAGISAVTTLAATELDIQNVIVPNQSDEVTGTNQVVALPIMMETDDSNRPRLEVTPQGTNLLLKCWLQNTQGILSIVASDCLTNLMQDGKSLAMVESTVSRYKEVLVAKDNNPVSFLYLMEYSTRSLNDFEEPGPSGEVASTPPLAYIGTTGIPTDLIVNQAFTVTFYVCGEDGLPLDADGEARLSLLDSNLQPVSFSYVFAPATVIFTNGLATASITIQSKNSLSGCVVGLDTAIQSLASNGLVQDRQNAASQAIGTLKIKDILGYTPEVTTPIPSELVVDKADPNWKVLLADKIEAYRKANGNGSPNWIYPLKTTLRQLTGNFGEWFRSGYRIHGGLDLKENAGGIVKAAEKGTIAVIEKAGANSYIVIDHGYGIWTLYQHIRLDIEPASKLRVLNKVTQGQEIAVVRDYPPSGTDGDHLHFGIRIKRNAQDNRWQCKGYPGNPINPLMDVEFRNVASPEQVAPEIKKIVFTPSLPSIHGYVKDEEKSTDFIKKGLPGSIYVMAQAVVLLDNKLAPYRIKCTPESGVQPLSPLEITMDDLDQANRYNPSTPSAQRLLDRGIAKYSGNSTNIPPDEKYRYWFKWDTSGYKSQPFGPRAIELYADDGMGNPSDTFTLTFGPKIENGMVVPLSGQKYKVTLVGNLGYKDNQINFTQPDIYKFELLKNGQPMTDVTWDTDPMKMNGNMTTLFSEHTGKKEYVFTLKPGVDSAALKLKISSKLVPDIAQEVDLSSCPSGPVTPGANMALIPAGSFTMGDTLDGYETPTHTVFVSGFYMDKYEVTKALWDSVYVWGVAHGYSFDNAGSGKASNHPVHKVNWYDMVKWCNARSEKEGRVASYYTDAAQTKVYRTGRVEVQIGWVKWCTGYRLPTEAEWEKAARGGASGKRFPWGDTITHSQANYCGFSYIAYDTSPTQGAHPSYRNDSWPCTSPVGSFAPNGYGLYDMAGNVMEWCWDRLDTYSSGSQTDPRGSTSGSGRVFRGGSWGSYADDCRVAHRIDYWQFNVNDGYLGFRSALPSGQP